MTYRAGIGLGMASLGFAPGPPHVRCDALGCSATFEAKVTRGGPPAWLRDGKAPPGWRTQRTGDRRWDFCHAHRHVRAAFCTCGVHDGPEFVPDTREAWRHMSFCTHSKHEHDADETRA